MNWSVSVELDGEPIVTLSHNHLAGRDLSSDDEAAIRTAAHHLLSFIGAVSPQPEPPRIEHLEACRIRMGRGNFGCCCDDLREAASQPAAVPVQDALTTPKEK